MKAKRFAALLLALLVVVPLVTACGSGGTSEGAATTAVAVSAATETVPAETEPPEPEYNFNGKSYRVFMDEEYIFQMYAEEETGDVTNDAIYARNVKIEEKYNYKTVPIITDQKLTKYWPEVNRLVLAGDDMFDICGQYSYNNVKAIESHTLTNWLDVPGVNLDAEYWNQEINDSKTINGRCYALTGYLSTTLMQFTYGIFFNTRITTDYGYKTDKLYADARAGKWTIDYLSTAVEGMYKDVNGDGNRDVNDQYGFATMPDNSPDFWPAAVEQPILQRNADGKFEVVINTPKTVSLVEKLLKLYYVNKGGMNYETITKYVTDGGDQYFAKGLVAFIPSTFLAAFNTYRDMEDDYGLLPPPKWDEAQTNYHSHIKDKYTVYSVPVTVKKEDLEFIGAVTDALCKESMISVYPLFFDTALKSKYSRDKDMAEMVDIIMEGVTFDAGFCYGGYINSVQVIVRRLIKENNPNFASEYAKLVFTLDDLYKLFED